MHPLAWLINGTKLNVHLSLMQFIWLKKHPKTLIITVQRVQLWVKGSAEQRQVLTFLLSSCCLERKFYTKNIRYLIVGNIFYRLLISIYKYEPQQGLKLVLRGLMTSPAS